MTEHKEFTVVRYVTERGLRLIQKGLSPAMAKEPHDVRWCYPVTIIYKPPPEQDFQGCACNWFIARGGSSGWIHDDGTECLLKDCQHDRYPAKKPPELRYVARYFEDGYWMVFDTVREKRLSHFPASYPGGPQAAAEAEAKRLNEMEQSE